MTEPIIVPIEAPGGTEAASTMRRFAATVVEAGVAEAKLTTAKEKLAAATTHETSETGKNDQQHKHHIRTIEQETLRLKAHEEQLRITAAARRQLGESFTPGDVSAVRSFARRSLGGGILGEAGKGIAEGLEGSQGGGLKGTLGAAGAGFAGGYVAFELQKMFLEHVGEEFKHEAEVRRSMVEDLRRLQSARADMGAHAADTHGGALMTLASLGGDSLVEAGQAFQKRIKDPSALEAYADAARRFGPGSRKMQGALEAAQNLSLLSGGKPISESMSKIDVGMMNISDNMGQGTDQLVADLLQTKGNQRVSKSEVRREIDNFDHSKTAATLAAGKGLDSAVDAAEQTNLGADAGRKHEKLAESLRPASAILIKKMNEGAEKDLALHSRVEAQDASIAGRHRFGDAIAGLQGMLHNFAPGLIGPNVYQEATRRSNEKFQEADRLMRGETQSTRDDQVAGHLQAAADLLRDRGRQSGAKPIAAGSSH